MRLRWQMLMGGPRRKYLSVPTTHHGMLKTPQSLSCVLDGHVRICDVYCRLHGFACQCARNDYRRCSGSCRRWVCLCNSTFVDARRFCRECYVRPCLERGCHGHLVKHFGTCMREFYCYKMACTSVWDRCHDHAALCELFCELRAAIKRKRPACYACTPCWDRLKHGAALLQHLGVPKDIVRLIIEKAVAAQRRQP